MLSKLANRNAKRAFSTSQLPTPLASPTAPGVTYNVPNQLFINGQWKDAKDGQTFDLINPGTGELITKVASAGPADVDEAVQAATQAATIWENVPPFVRSRMMIAFADKIEAHADELATLEAEDNGKMY